MTTTIDALMEAVERDVHLEHLPPDKLLTVEQVLALIPVSKRVWLEGVRSGRFPHAVRLSSKAMFWRVSDIRIFIQGLRAEPPAE
jgi:predicted DNA-binding transcriptional regulator AlpA